MEGFLANVGMLAITFLVVYIYKKMLEWYDDTHSGAYADQRIYKAADEFSHGAPTENIIAILNSCIELNADDAKEILSLADPYKTDKDRGYKAFIRSVNMVLGEEVYDEKHHVRFEIKQ